jgi:hypothetical protein
MIIYIIRLGPTYMPFVKSIGGKNKNSIVFVGHLIYGGKLSFLEKRRVKITYLLHLLLKENGREIINFHKIHQKKVI